MNESKSLEEKENEEKRDPETNLEYVRPRIITYTSEQIMEQIGPAQACSPFG